MSLPLDPPTWSTKVSFCRALRMIRRYREVVKVIDVGDIRLLIRTIFLPYEDLFDE